MLIIRYSQAKVYTMVIEPDVMQQISDRMKKTDLPVNENGHSIVKKGKGIEKKILGWYISNINLKSCFYSFSHFRTCDVEAVFGLSFHGYIYQRLLLQASQTTSYNIFFQMSKKKFELL